MWGKGQAGDVETVDGAWEAEHRLTVGLRLKDVLI